MGFLKTVGCGCPGCGSGPCDPPDVPPPTLLCDSVEATASKDGYYEFPGYESTPPKVYRDLNATGSMIEEVWEGGDGCVGGPDETIDIDYSGVAPGYDVCGLGQCPPSYTATTAQIEGAEECVGIFPSHKYTGTITWTISNEFTTAQLIAAVEGDLGSYPGTWDGDCSAYRNLTSDEFSFTLRKFRYVFELPDLTGYTTYHIEWSEGGTPRSYDWNGSDTETPIYEVAAPGSNGTIDITDVVASCS